MQSLFICLPIVSILMVDLGRARRRGNRRSISERAVGQSGEKKVEIPDYELSTFHSKPLKKRRPKPQNSVSEKKGTISQPGVRGINSIFLIE